MPAAGRYESVIASGAASGRDAFSASVSEFDGSVTSWLEATARPAASRPEIDQPAAPVPGDRTGSLNTTRMVSSETAVALRTDGDWPSASARGIVSVLSNMSDPDDTAVPLMSTWPVAFGGAPPGENVSVWMWPPLPPTSSPVTFRRCPSTTSDEYASRSAAALLVYVMVAVLGPVIFDECISSTLPSSISTFMMPPTSWFFGSAPSSTIRPSIVMLLVGSGMGASAPVNASTCRLRNAAGSCATIGRSTPPISRFE